MHLVLCPVKLPPLPHDLGLARGGVGGSVSGHSSVARERASVSSALRELGSGLPLPTPLPRLLLPAHHSSLGDMSQEKFRRTAPLFDPHVFPDLRIEEHGRIVELALGRTALVTVTVVLAPLTIRGQAVESVKGGHPLGRCHPASGRDLRIAPTFGACALVLGEAGLDPRIDTGRSLLTATDRVDSVRVPPLAVLVTACGLVDDSLPPLTVRGQRREDSEPDVSSRRVWRR